MTRDTEDVPISKIHDYVTPAELQRFEHKDFEDERERERESERLRRLYKPRGRPRKDGLPRRTPTAATTTLKAVAVTPSRGYTSFRSATGEGKKRGRPVGWRKNAVPPPNSIPAPSFNGPQPTSKTKAPDEPSTREQSVDQDTPLDIQSRTGIYSMVAASGLIPIDSETEPDASRDITPLHPTFEAAEFAQPSPKRPRIDEPATPLHSPNGTRNVSLRLSPTPPPPPHGDVDDERRALPSQFDGKSMRQWSPDQPSSESLLSTIKICPPPISHNVRISAAPTVQTTPSRRPKRRSLTPHFPGGRWWQLGGKSGKRDPSGMLSPSSNRKKATLNAQPQPSSIEKVTPAAPPRRPSPTTIKRLAPSQRNVFRDITSYFP